MAEFQVRHARAGDAAAIKSLIHAVEINPMGLDWRRFILAESSGGTLMGCGQVKPHGRHVSELASIAVWPDFRGQGVARAVIEHLISQNPGVLYLMCLSTMQALYEKFDFHEIPRAQMPRYFRRITGLFAAIAVLGRQGAQLIVMRRDSPLAA
jgi:N-acetylglutamate synthase-like GNAT family acetyltransferase